jgi:predicted LPLAT superfamily acyltransferase
VTNPEPDNKTIKPPPKFLFKYLEALGHQFFYFILFTGGQLSAYVLLFPVVFTYVLFSRKIHRQTSYYRHKRFPQHGSLQHWLTTFKIVHSFSQVLVDRAWLGKNKKVALEGEIKGIHKLEHAIEQRKGIVLLTAHVGNWQSALSNISQLPLPINSLMHYEEVYVTKHFFELQGKPCPFHIISIDSFMGGMVEATAALQKGEIVTIMGDRLTKGASAEVDFLGSPAAFPISAYALAAKTGASVAIILASKTSRKKYTLEVKDVFKPHYESRETRQTHLKNAVQIFVNSLEGYLKDNPYQWYNFYDFWGKI